MAGGATPDLRSGEEKLPTAQAGSGHARDAPGNRGRSHSRLTGNGPLWTAQHRHNSAGESDHSTWNSRSGASHLGDGSAVPTPFGPSGMVARVLSFCTPPCLAAGEARAAARTRWQASGATLSATDSRHGGRENEPTMECRGSALFSPAAGPLLRLLRAPSGFRGFAKWQRPRSDAESSWGWRATG